MSFRARKMAMLVSYCQWALRPQRPATADRIASPYLYSVGCNSSQQHLRVAGCSHHIGRPHFLTLPPRSALQLWKPPDGYRHGDQCTRLWSHSIAPSGGRPSRGSPFCAGLLVPYGACPLGCVNMHIARRRLPRVRQSRTTNNVSGKTTKNSNALTLISLPALLCFASFSRTALRMKLQEQLAPSSHFFLWCALTTRVGSLPRRRAATDRGHPWHWLSIGRQRPPLEQQK